MPLLEYLGTGTSPYHVTAYCAKKLKEAGFKELAFDKDFTVETGQGYYVRPYGSALFAFWIPTMLSDGSMHIACAHTDFPALKIKSNPDIKKGDNSYVCVNVEPYGGMLKRTWFDRPLGIAGSVILDTNSSDKSITSAYTPSEVLFDSEEAWCMLPSMAPHMDRDIEKKEIDIQKEMLPICMLGGEQDCLIQESLNQKTLLQAIANKLNVTPEQILDYDLFLYNIEPAAYVGIHKEMLSAARIDNIASVAALVEAMIANATAINPSHDGIHDISCIALFDNEEIGSRSKQGADSLLFTWILEKLYASPLLAAYDYKNAMAKSMLLSVDGAHALHPNYPEKADLTNQVYLGKGVVIKSSASQRYVSDGKSAAIIRSLCNAAHIPCQKQINRSGMAGGQTLGPITASFLPILAADIGIPMLAMHSARELACQKDWDALLQLMKIWLAF